MSPLLYATIDTTHVPYNISGQTEAAAAAGQKQNEPDVVVRLAGGVRTGLWWRSGTKAAEGAVCAVTRAAADEVDAGAACAAGVVHAVVDVLFAEVALEARRTGAGDEARAVVAHAAHAAAGLAALLVEHADAIAVVVVVARVALLTQRTGVADVADAHRHTVVIVALAANAAGVAVGAGGVGHAGMIDAATVKALGTRLAEVARVAHEAGARRRGALDGARAGEAARRGRAGLLHHALSRLSPPLAKPSWQRSATHKPLRLHSPVPQSLLPRHC